MMRLRALLLILAVLSGPALAQSVVISPGPDRVSVTVYRDPGRPAGQPMNLSWLQGYSLITEQRQVILPAGEVEIRFEGVAGGILPQSAIVTGLPDGIVERNRDAYLLSPATLLDRSLGHRVHLRRTSLATGEVREQEAIIRSGAGGAVVLQTQAGFEALRCTGFRETLIYDEVPQGLSSRPTLSVRTRSLAPVNAVITLAYLAGGFDWQANYIAMLAPDGRSLQLSAWLTLANGDETSFAQADTQAVAGRLNREPAEPPPSEAPPLRLQCWPSDTTSSLPFVRYGARAPPPPPAPPPSPSMMMAQSAESVVVTGSRVMRAQQEELGDLKLYRIPEPVTVAANSQKQVALIDQPRVAVDFVHRSRIYADKTYEPGRVSRFLIARNRESEGLGLPLPAGGMVLFVERDGRPILIGEGRLDDSAVGEDVEVELEESPQVQIGHERVAETKEGQDYRLTVTNALPRPVRFEGEFEVDPEQEFRPSRRLRRRDGRPLWEVTIPANGQASLAYRLVLPD